MGTQVPLPKNRAQPPIFGHVDCGQTVAHLSYCWALVIKSTRSTLKISPSLSWTTLNCQNDQLCAPDRTQKGSIASCSMLPSRLMFTKSVTVSVSASKMGVVFINHKSERQRTVLLGYLTVPTNVRRCIIASLITILSFSKTMHWLILHSTHSNCFNAKLSIDLYVLSPEPWPHNSLELNYTRTVRFRELHSSMSVVSNKTD